MTRNRRFVLLVIIMMAALALLLAGCGVGPGSVGPVVPEVATQVAETADDGSCSVADNPPCYVPEGWMLDDD